jgi:Zn finger protein HypA/HybF involved in hydrogenase expression
MEREDDMSEINLTAEQLAFDCQHCGHRWVTSYEKQYGKFNGSEAVTWYHNGQPTTSPWIDPMCPICGGHRTVMRPLALR